MVLPDLLEISPVSVILLIVFLILTYSFYAQYLCDIHLPPKIRGFPVLGILPYLTLSGKPLEELCLEWSRKYDDVFTIYLGVKPVVILASYDAHKETIKKKPEIYSNRPDLYTLKTLSGGKGIAFHQYGEGWKDARKFTSQVLKDFGVGKSSLEEKILEETQAVRNEISNRRGSEVPFDPQPLLQSAVSNIICSINFGTRYDYSDKKFQVAMYSFAEFARTLATGSLVDLYPILRYVPGLNANFKRCYQLVNNIHVYIREKIDDHQATFDPNNIRDFIDLYLKAVADGKVSKTLCESQMFQIITDMFAAGTETTSTTLNWSLFYLCHNPEIQEKIHKELDTEFGNSCYAKLKDKNQLPYTNAFLLEVQRHVTMVPLSLPHATASDTNFRNYHIPKGTMIFPALYCIHRDEKYFQDSGVFNPDRWLNGKGEIVNNEALVPFSSGYRVCIGEQLAKMELFLFFTGLLQTYKVSSYGKLPPQSDVVSSIVRQPPPYQLIMDKR